MLGYKYSEGTIMVNIFDTINEVDEITLINQVHNVEIIKILL